MNCLRLDILGTSEAWNECGCVRLSVERFFSGGSLRQMKYSSTNTLVVQNTSISYTQAGPRLGC